MTCYILLLCCEVCEMKKGHSWCTMFGQKLDRVEHKPSNLVLWEQKKDVDPSLDEPTTAWPFFAWPKQCMEHWGSQPSKQWTQFVTKERLWNFGWKPRNQKMKDKTSSKWTKISIRATIKSSNSLRSWPNSPSFSAQVIGSNPWPWKYTWLGRSHWCPETRSLHWHSERREHPPGKMATNNDPTGKLPTPFFQELQSKINRTKTNCSEHGHAHSANHRGESGGFNRWHLSTQAWHPNGCGQIYVDCHFAIVALETDQLGPAREFMADGFPHSHFWGAHIEPKKEPI